MIHARMCQYPCERPKSPITILSDLLFTTGTIDDYNEISRSLRFEKGVQHTTDYLLSNPLPRDRIIELQAVKIVQDKRLHDIENQIFDLTYPLQKIRNTLNTMLTNDITLQPKKDDAIHTIIKTHVDFLNKIQNLAPDRLNDHKIRNAEILA